jgi:hypothetical protein
MIFEIRDAISGDFHQSVFLHRLAIPQLPALGGVARASVWPNAVHYLVPDKLSQVGKLANEDSKVEIVAMMRQMRWQPGTNLRHR